MAISAPARDPDFASHPVHGADAQRALFKTVTSYCVDFRTAVDVGAHIGLWTRMLADRFDLVWAFEPVSENFDCLIENVSRSHIVCAQVALGDRRGLCGMELPEKGNSGCWHMKDQGDMEVSTLDTFYKVMPNVDLIKIDVEGAEGKVIDGARKIIFGNRPVIVLEDNGLGPKYFGADWSDPKLTLTALGYYRAQRINKDEIWVPS